MENFKLAVYCHAIGDALGNPFEFNDPTVRQVRDYLNSDARITYTDDTQMMLATAVGLTKDDPKSGVEKEYLDWYEGQAHIGRNDVDHLEGLLQFEAYRANEAPGINTMRMLRDRYAGRFSYSDSNGCGTVMRMMPYAFLKDKRLTMGTAVELALDGAYYTHQGDEIAPSTRAYLGYAWDLTDFYDFPTKYIQSGGRTALDCLTWAARAVEFNTSFEHCMEQCIAHEGDSDSIAAVAGSLWAIKKGKPEHFDRYVKRLRGKDALDYTIKMWEQKYGE